MNRIIIAEASHKLHVQCRLINDYINSVLMGDLKHEPNFAAEIISNIENETKKIRDNI